MNDSGAYAKFVSFQSKQPDRMCSLPFPERIVSEFVSQPAALLIIPSASSDWSVSGSRAVSDQLHINIGALSRSTDHWLRNN